MSLQWQDDMDDVGQQVLKDKDAIQGIILDSAKSTFFAGADLKGTMRLRESDASRIFGEIERVKKNFRIIETLGKPVVSGTLKTPMPSLRPYQGILLLFEAEEIIKTLLPDSSSLLIRFIQTVTPNTSFEQMQTILDCSLSQIYRMAAHLHFWGQARIIQSTVIFCLDFAFSNKFDYVIM